MGLVSHYLAYRVGKKRGRNAARRDAEDRMSDNDERDPDCINYTMFCKNYGSCDGQTCEYD